MQVILERVKIDLDEDEIRRLIDAVDHYEAYLHSQQRDEEKFRELLSAPAQDAGVMTIVRTFTSKDPDKLPLTEVVPCVAFAPVVAFTIRFDGLPTLRPSESIVPFAVPFPTSLGTMSNTIAASERVSYAD